MKTQTSINLVIGKPMSVWSLGVILLAPSGHAQTPNGFFTDVKPVAGLEGSYFDVQPDIAFDNLTIYFASRDRPGAQGGSDIYRATRAHPTDPFGTPARLGSPVNSSDSESTPHLSEDGLTLYFSSNRPGGAGDYDLYQASRPSTDVPFSNVINLGAGVNSSANDHSASVSSDGLVMYFASSRDDFGYLYVASRRSIEESFGNVVRLGNTVNSSDAFQFDVALAPDGVHLLFSRWHAGRAYDLHVAGQPSSLQEFSQETDLDAFGVGSSINTSCFENGATFSWDWPANGSKVYFQKDCTSDYSDIDIWEATWVSYEVAIEKAVILSWPIQALPYYDLYGADSIDGDWSRIDEPVIQRGNLATVAVPASDKMRFFRLQSTGL